MHDRRLSFPAIPSVGPAFADRAADASVSGRRRSSQALSAVTVLFLCFGCASQTPPVTPEKLEISRLEAENQKLRARVTELESARALASAPNSASMGRETDRDAPGDVELETTPTGIETAPTEGDAPSAGLAQGRSGGHSATTRPGAGPEEVGDGRQLPVVRLSPGHTAGEAVEPSERRPLLTARGTSHSRVDHLEPLDDGSAGDAPLRITGDGDAGDFDAGIEAFEAGRYRECVTLLSKFLQAHGDHPFTDSALYYRGEARRELGQAGPAKADFELVVQRYPDEAVAADALLALGTIELERGNESAARKAFQAIVLHHASSSALARIPERYLK